jgi:hypothetical protein
MPFFEAEAKKRQAHGKTAPGKRSSPIGDKRPKRLAADDAAKAFNTSSRTVQRSYFQFRLADSRTSLPAANAASSRWVNALSISRYSTIVQGPMPSPSRGSWLRPPLCSAEGPFRRLDGGSGVGSGFKVIL